MTNLVTSLHSVLTTIPRAGVSKGGMIPDKIGDIHRFSSSNKFLATTRLAPLFISPATLLPRKPEYQSMVLKSFAML